MAEGSVRAADAAAFGLSWDDQPGQPQHFASVGPTSQQPSSSTLSSSSTPPPDASAAASSDSSQSSITAAAHGTHDLAVPAVHSTTNGHASYIASTASAADTSHSSINAATSAHDGSTILAQQQPSPDASAASVSSSTSPADGTATANRKRHSRWGDNVDSTEPVVAVGSAVAAATAESRKRSRWGDKDASNTPTSAGTTVAGATPAMAAALTAAAIAAKLGQSSFTPTSLEEVKLQLRIDELTRLMHNPLAHLSSDEPRSPSPEPTYDGQGQRTNTREQRYKLKHTTERNDLILQLTSVNPSYRPPADWKKQTRFERRVYIPQKDYPDYNFIGLIIGPRGSTQKQMEKETGCKIVIRGKGSSKEGKSRTSGRPDESENDETHVLVTGDDKAKVDSAASMVEKLMVPVDDATNEHKSKQLRELALINGTLRDDIVCRVCGQRGHKLFECPERTGAAWKPAEVRCEWCGETTHISTDCPRREEGKERREEWDAEYATFMNEITGGSLQEKGISGLIEENKRGAPGEGSAWRGREDAGRLGEGGRSGQLMLTDGVDRRPSNVMRVGDGIVRRIVSNDPRETAREYRPLNPPPSSQMSSSASFSQAPASGHIHPSRMHPSSYHAVPPPSSVARPPPPPPPPQPPAYGAYPPSYPYYMPPPHSYYPPPHGPHAPPPGAAYPPYYPSPPPAAASPAMPAASHPPPSAAAVPPPAAPSAPSIATSSPSPSATNGAGRTNRYQQWPPPAPSTSGTSDIASSATKASRPAGMNKYAVWPPPSMQ